MSRTSAPLLHLSSSDPQFHAMVESVAQACVLTGGALFTPYPVMPANARMAPPPIQEAYLRVEETDALGDAATAISGWLQDGRTLAVAGQGGNRTFDAAAKCTPDELESLLGT